MSKTLAIILNHNRKEYTNRLFKSLKPYEASGNYDLIIMDNGSTDKDEISEYTSIGTESNCYFGGALNLTFSLALEHSQYDSILFLNNDIIVHPYNFVSTLRSAMFDGNYKVVSPSVIQPEEGQCYWPQMHNWGHNSPRAVRWLDFICPLIHRDVIEYIKQYDMDLIYGWGQDVYTGIVCEEQGWNLAVLDTTTLVHFSSQTLKDNKGDITLSDFNNRAMGGMMQFFDKVRKMDKLQEFRNWGLNYKA